MKCPSHYHYCLLLLPSILIHELSLVAAAPPWSADSVSPVLGFVGASSGSGGIRISGGIGYYSSLRTIRRRRLHNNVIRNSSITSSSSSKLAAKLSEYDHHEVYYDHDESIVQRPPPLLDGEKTIMITKSKRPTPKAALSSIEVSGGDVGSGGYWIDENDPFVIVMNGGKVFATGGDDAQGSISSSSNKRQKSNSDDDDDNDVGIDLSSRKSMKFTIRGNPRVLIRHRSARGYTYNPSRPAQDEFRNCLLKLMPPMLFHHTTNDKPNTKIVDDGSTWYDDDDDIDTLASSSPSSPSTTTLFAQDECLQLSITFRMKRPKSHFISNQPGYGRLKSSAPSSISIRNLRSDVDNMAKFVMDSLNGLVYVDDRQVVELNVRKVLDSEGLCLGATDVEIRVVTEEEAGL